jgi:olfactory receptor
LFDISFVSTTVPKMIVNIHIQSRAFFYVGYLTQMYFFVLCGCVDEKLLTVMAYDLFLTICHTLYYPVIRSPHLCVFSVELSFLASF